MVVAIIVGAGEGRRMGSTGGRKQFTKISGKPLIAYTLEPFEKCQLIDHMVLVVPPDSIDWVREEIVGQYRLKKVREIVAGGETRQQSVWNGLNVVSNNTEKVVIHDAVRPFVNETLIKRVIDASRKTGAAITAVPVKDTVKQVESGEVVGTLDRRLLWLAQTPQCFDYQIIVEAHKMAAREKIEATDDASLVEKYGAKVAVAVGSYANLKVTSPEDLPLLEYFLRQDRRIRLEQPTTRQRRTQVRSRARRRRSKRK